MPAVSPAMTPKQLVLALLRVAHEGHVRVGALLSAGALFGLTGNAMRVAITRLVARGAIESDDRGSYRLSARTDPQTAHVERWREGESRKRRWDAQWLVVVPPRGAERSTRRHSLHALGLLGFREGLDGLWVRPHNLAEPLSTTLEHLTALGLDADAHHLVASDLDKSLELGWQTSLWPLARLEQGYRRALDAVERSRERVESMSTEQALVETVLVAGTAIHVIATDPLLPDEILPSFARRELTDATLGYEESGRRVWERFRRDFESSPSDVPREASPSATGTH